MAFSALLRFYISPLVAWSNPPGMQVVPILAFALAIVQGSAGKRFWSVRVAVAILAFFYQLVLLRDYYAPKEKLYLFGGAGVMIFALLLLSPWLTDLALRRFAELRRATA